MRSKIKPLTSCRFFAAAAILFHHTREYLATSPALASQIHYDQAVSFFFVLSGFILAFSYPDLECKREVFKFYRARLARLLPLHALCFLVVVVTFPVLLSESGFWWMAPLNLFMVHAWIPVERIFYSFNSASWSISTESLFYVCFPFLIQDFQRSWHKKLLSSAALLCGMVFICVRTGLPLEESDPRNISMLGLVYIHPVARLFEFVLGMSSFLLWGKFKDRYPSDFRTATMIEVSILVSVSWMIFVPLTRVCAGHVAVAGFMWLAHSEACFAFALSVPIFAMSAGLVSRILSMSLLVLLGEISYSIYMLHQVFLAVVEKEFPGLITRLSAAGLGLLWSSIIAISYFTWKFFETPHDFGRQAIAKALVEFRFPTLLSITV